MEKQLSSMTSVRAEMEQQLEPTLKLEMGTVANDLLHYRGLIAQPR